MHGAGHSAPQPAIVRDHAEAGLDDLVDTAVDHGRGDAGGHCLGGPDAVGMVADLRLQFGHVRGPLRLAGPHDADGRDTHGRAVVVIGHVVMA